jgi:Uma2 family endonuclease
MSMGTHCAQHVSTHEDLLVVHANAVTALDGILAAACSGWVFVKVPKLHLGPHVVVPDLAAWRSRRPSSVPERAWIDRAPDWVCEVLSPSTEAHDRCEKRTIYAKAGVGHLWFVSPRPQMLEVFELRDGMWLLLDVLSGNAVVQAPPFQELAFALTRLWPYDAASEKRA